MRLSAVSKRYPGSIRARAHCMFMRRNNLRAVSTVSGHLPSYASAQVRELRAATGEERPQGAVIGGGVDFCPDTANTRCNTLWHNHLRHGQCPDTARIRSGYRATTAHVFAPFGPCRVVRGPIANDPTRFQRRPRGEHGRSANVADALGTTRPWRAGEVAGNGNHFQLTFFRERNYE